MKINTFPQRYVIAALFLLSLPAVVQAQFTYVTNSDGVTVTITGYTGSGGAVVIPNNINGYTVTSIGTQAFQQDDVTSVIIPNSVTNIGPNAFYLCTNLSSITIPGSVANIGFEAFRDCRSLTSVTIPANVANFGDFAFEFCTGLTSVTILGTVTSIGEAAFAFCGSLTNVTILSRVTSLGEGAFGSCTNLTTAYFQGNSPSGQGNAFFGDPHAVVYYLPGTTGWSTSFGGVPTKLWYQPQPQVLTFEPSFGVQNEQFGFTISWATNASVIVQASTNLANPVWILVATNALSNGTNYFSDTQWTNYPCRFYRVSGP